MNCFCLSALQDIGLARLKLEEGKQELVSWRRQAFCLCMRFLQRCVRPILCRLLWRKNWRNEWTWSMQTDDSHDVSIFN